MGLAWRRDGISGKTTAGDRSRAHHGSVVLKSGFRYFGDPAFVVACLLYVLNSGWWADQGGWFFRSYFNDLLLIPCALPGILWLHARLGWRCREAYPTLSEVAGHLCVWALVAEGLGPIFFANAVGDPWDVLAYAVGAVAALAFWRLAPGTVLPLGWGGRQREPLSGRP